MTDLFEPIAIVGIAGRLPGARDVREFWRNLAAGHESISRLTDEELLAAGVPSERIEDPAYVKLAGLVPGVDEFDPDFFGMTPHEARICDPQLRLFLEVTHEAIEDAGYDPARDGRDIAVYGASGPSRYGEQNVLANPRYAGEAGGMGFMVLNNVDYLTTLASYKLDLRGPSMAVLTACSSSLTAVHLACRSLQLGECDAAVAGASNVEIPYRTGYRWSPGDVRSADGHCRPFDASGTGTIFTSGAGAVLLKRLDDAIADAHHIWGVIEGVGITNDGNDKVSFSAPSVAGQAAAVEDAMLMAGRTPADIGCVELHATGTPLGDPIEVKALASAYERLSDGPLDPGRIPIGSVKGNIGHTIPTAGLAGLLKLVLALEHERIPPTIGVTVPNPRLELARTPFFLNDEARPWPRTADGARRAGLSSLGIGGTNVHLVVAEGPAPVPTPHRDRPRLVVWSGTDEAAVAANRAALAEHFQTSGEDTFADAVSTLHRGRRTHPVRAAAVCAGAAEAARVLASGEGVLSGGPGGAEPPGLVLAFPGQGVQYPRMAAGLYGRQRVFTDTMDECLDLLAHRGADLWPLWLADDPGAALHETANTQPLLFAIEYAMARQWITWCGAPVAVLGHSIGELAAATVAGVFAVEDALRLVLARGRAMQQQPRGGMLAVSAAPERVRTLPLGDVVVAAVNAPEQTVLAGPAAGLDRVAAAAEAEGIGTRPVRTSHAFHSPAMRPAVREFAAAFAGVALAAPRLPLYSAATGQPLSQQQATDPDFWARQLARPVLFAEAAETAAKELGRGIVLETGPGTMLSNLLRRNPAFAGGDWAMVPTLPGRRAGAAPPREEVSDVDERQVLRALGELWVAGLPFDWRQVYRDEQPQRASLPGYRFQRQKYWVDRVDRVDPATAAEPTAVPEEPTEHGPFLVPVWVEGPRLELGAAENPERQRPTALTLLPTDPRESAALTTSLEHAGYDVCAVHIGEEFTRDGEEFAVREANLADDLARVLAQLRQRGRAPSVLVHALATDTDTDTAADRELAAELDRTFFALLDLVRQGGRAPVDGRLPSLLVLTRDAVDVSGGEAVSPVGAALVAAARTFALESPESGCRVVDLAGARAPESLAAELRAGTEAVVALRGRRRWLPAQRPWSEAATEVSPIREEGTYVITGGLGGLGLAVARGLAATGQRPRIALLGRTPRDVGNELAELEGLGARVETFRCDVADRERLGHVMDEVAARLGPVRAVLHLAGVAGDGMLWFRSREEVERVLRPKVRGTIALADVLADRPPVDFVACFSSRAALTGMVGGGDYAAANAFLDAFAASRPNWVSINWPGWTTVGMARDGALDKLSAALRAARAGNAPAAAPDGDLHHETVLSPATHWALDEHRIGQAPVLPGTGIVDLILRAYLDVVPGATAPVTLRDVVFLRPLAGETPRRTRVSFAGTGGGSWRVRVLSRLDDSVGEGEQWQEHATATAAPATAEDVPAPRAEDLAGGLTEVAPPSMLPSPGDAFVFGPRWHNVERLWESGDVTVAELALPPAFAAETGEHAVHPALLDTGAGLARRHHRGLTVPFTYRSMTWYAPLPARVRSRIRSWPGDDPVADAEFVAPDGSVVVTIEGLRMRPALLTDFSSEPGTEAEPAESGLSPTEGVELLLRLLAAPTPANIAVADRGEPEQPPSGEVSHSGSAAEPTGTVQERLAQMWRQLLGRPFVGPEDDFFDLGGDSLMGVALTGRIRDSFGVQLSIGSLFDYPTLGALADALREQGAS